MRNTDNKSISLEPGLLRRAKRRAREKGFKNSFSAYVAHLISRDLTQSQPPTPPIPEGEVAA